MKSLTVKSLTKNHQTPHEISKMVEYGFPSCKMIGYRELTEGYFNAAYEIHLSDGRQVILKIAPAPGTRVMTYEKNIMSAEVQALKMAKAAGVPSPEVLVFDENRTICPSPYFFMEKLEGQSLNSIKETLSSVQAASIHQEVGRICRQIHQISCPCFGYPAQPEFQGRKWYPVFRKMLCSGIQDARRGGVNLKIDTDWILKKLESERDLLDEVTEPVLVHWDSWDGNIFVKDGKVTGIIDWERSLWADPLMEVGFRTYDPNPDFMTGYGMSLTESQKRRALWYDIYLMILVSLECEYRQYETMEIYEWASGVLSEQVKRLGK